MINNKLSLIVTFAVTYTNDDTLNSLFVTVTHHLNEVHTHEYIETRQLNQDVKDHIQHRALVELANNHIYPAQIITLRVIKK